LSWKLIHWLIFRFGIGIRDTRRPQFAAGYILLALALQHGALYGISTVDDLAKYDLSNGPIPLRWKDEYLEKPVLRNVTADGPQDVPIDAVTFCECLRVIFTAAGYEKRPVVHEIRKHLGKLIEGKFTKHTCLKEEQLLTSRQESTALHQSPKSTDTKVQEPIPRTIYYSALQ
jgi:hypothetical protein